jgi:glycosyltransferase involved in cell wall biosynthesis
VVTVHDLAAFAVKGKYDTARMLYGRYVVRALARQATIVSTVSHATAADIEKYFGLPLEHVPVIWNGIDHDLCRPPAPADLQAALTRLQQLKPYFIYLARLEHPGKNHVRLIEAFEQFCHDCPAQPHELLLGGADWHGAEVIHQRIADSPMRNRIRALGFVDKADLPIWYAGATAMVYPSLFEGFGLPLAEAMACGCPVISSDRGSLGEVAGGAARLVDAESVPSITAALREFVENPEAAQTWRAHGLARAQEFKWEKAATAMTHLYKQAAGGLA